MNKDAAKVGQTVTVKGSKIVYLISSLDGARLDMETFTYFPAAHLVRADGKHKTPVSALWDNVTPL